MLCSFGCNQEATIQLKNGKWCCLGSVNKCPGMRKKNSDKLKEVMRGRIQWYALPGKTHPLKGTVGWNTGLTKDTDIRVKHSSEGIKEYYQTHDGSFTNKTHTCESRQKIAAAKMGNKYSKRTKNPDAFYKNQKMDSMWEVGYAYFLDSHNLIWKYESITFPLGDNESYTPDFIIYHVDGSIHEIHEIKGLFRENNRLKFEKFKLSNPQLIIKLLQYDELLSLGVIDKSGYIIMNKKI